MQVRDHPYNTLANIFRFLDTFLPHVGSFLKLKQTCLIKAYSHLFNKRGGWNKRGGGANVAKSINVKVGINVEGAIFLEKSSK